MLAKTVNGIAAGCLISIGGCVYLSCSDNKYVGAVLFSVALLCICYKGFSLFTGKVGGMIEEHDGIAFKVLLCGLLGNIIATLLLGLAASYTFPDIANSARTICSLKLEQSPLQALFRAFMCGILMHMAVSIYREKKTALGILFCVPTFILSGFEHSIADMFYFFTARLFSLAAFGYLLLIVVGNAAGALSIAFFEKIGKEGAKNEKS